MKRASLWRNVLLRELYEETGIDISDIDPKEVEPYMCYESCYGNGIDVSLKAHLVIFFKVQLKKEAY